MNEIGFIVGFILVGWILGIISAIGIERLIKRKYGKYESKNKSLAKAITLACCEVIRKRDLQEADQ